MKKKLNLYFSLRENKHKILLKMKLTLFMLMLFMLQVSAKVYSQNVKFNFEVRNEEVAGVLKQIESSSNYRFFFQREQVDVTRKVNLIASDNSVEDILDTLFHDEGITYKILDDNLILLLPANSARTQGVGLTQQLSVTGKVIDASTGEPMPGVNIHIKGTTIGTVSNADGNFLLSVPDRNATLTFSFIGYTTQEVFIGDKTAVNVALEKVMHGIEEVVVVGYGTQRKATLTGSVASIGSEKIISSPSTNVKNAIGGLMTGIITKMSSGEPGRNNPVLLIRGRNTTGNNEPLVVVDGVQGVSGWEEINANDIESISILKDASAAIYGARAANGVILITTKRGSLSKPLISFSYNQAITQPTRIPEMANSAELAEYINQVNVAAGRSPAYTDEEIQKFRDGTDPDYINEDWFGKVLKRSSFQNQHNLSVRGGSESIKYSISGSYSQEGSIFKNGSLNYKTYSLRNNLDAQINKYLKVTFDLNGSLNDGNYPAYSTTTTFQALRQVPFEPVFWPNGLPSTGIGNSGLNPAVMCSSLTGNNNIKILRFNIKNTFDLTIPYVKGLGIDGYFAYSNNVTLDKNWQTPWITYNHNKATDTYVPITGGGISSPQLTQTYTGLTSLLVNLRVKYEVNINDHHLSSFIAAEESNDKYSTFNAFRKGYISTTLDELFAGSLVDQATGGRSAETGRKNFFGRISYGFKDKYLLDFNFRYDGSSNFPKGKQFGFFPGISVGWRISQEKFLRDNISFINNLKLRASIGKIGNDAISPFQYLTLYTLGNTGMSYGLPPVATNGLIAGVSPNPNITWEVAKTVNVGMDASFWNGLLGFTVDLFKQTRSNILATRNLSIPQFSGLSLPSENIGKVDNKGIELEVTHSKIVGDFSWRVAGNISYSRNRIVFIDEAPNVPAWQKVEGRVLGAAKYYHAIGIFRAQEEIDAAPVYPGTIVGNLRYEDTDKDGSITANDQVIMNKTSTPEIVFGFNLSLNYKDFSLWANLAGAGRVWQYLHCEARVTETQFKDIIVNRYTPGSMTSKYPILPMIEAGSGEVDGLYSDFWLKDASYIRLKTLELSYSLPKDLLEKFRLQTMKIFINGQNLFTIDKVKWVDPENTAVNSAYYPQSKIYNVGVNLIF